MEEELDSGVQEEGGLHSLVGDVHSKTWEISQMRCGFGERWMFGKIVCSPQGTVGTSATFAGPDSEVIGLIN